MLQCVKKQTLPFSNKIFRFYFSPCRIFRNKCYGRTRSTEATTELLKVQASDRYRRLPHVFTVTQPRLQFPFWKWEMSKKESKLLQALFVWFSSSFSGREKAGGCVRAGWCEAGWRDRWRLPKVRNCQARNLLWSNMELTETKFWIFSIIVAPDTHFGKSVKKVAPISFEFSNCEKVNSGEKWSQHLKPPYDGHFYPMRQR